MALFIALLFNSSRYDYLLRDSRCSALQNFKVFTVTSLVKRNQLSFLWLQNSKMEESFLLKLGFCKKQVSNIFRAAVSDIDKLSGYMHAAS